MTKMGLSIHQQLRLVLSILSVFLATVSMASSFKTPIPSPPPVSVPVYSLTTSTTGSSTSAAPESSSSTSSMNIVTFATPVSINPKLYMISLYHGTKTKDTFFQSKHGILQLLDKRQKDLVPLLGKRSGYDYEEGQGYDKEKECDGAGFPWGTVRAQSCSKLLFAKNDCADYDSTCSGRDDLEERIRTFDGMRVLPQCQSYIAVKLIDTMEGGDHELALCEVMGVGEWDEEGECVVCVDDGGVNVEAKNDEDSVLYTGYLRKEGVL